MTASTTPPPDATPPVEVLRSEERLRVGTHRVPVERVRLSRRVVTETRLVEVQLRREELHVERLAVTGDEQVSGPIRPEPSDDLVLVLSREVPVVTVRSEPYERVRVRVVTAASEQPVTASLLREQVDIHIVGAAGTGVLRTPAPPAPGSTCTYLKPARR